ncbi:alcohol dehydrogenase [Fusarium denticulatum]|uniref:Alcohol dehydrogenase n=1 Tax=Fusarium denticulatum TaxID=48507 RepID=A0A8H5UFD0_9HYPO|nr:alcohol dehydrogenase [Fusarium denticulatum]
MSDLEGVFDKVSAQPQNLPLLATQETCSGRTYIVTGANSGLGFEAAKHLVALDASQVILAVRNLSAGSKAKADIEASTGKTGSIKVWHLDLPSYKSVEAFAKRAALELDRIDALVENAGLAAEMDNFAQSHPAMFTVNVYSTLLLAVLLLPKMKEDAQRLKTTPHITIVSSNSAFHGKPLWDLCKDATNPLQKIVEVGQLDMGSGYTVSKLFLLLAVRHIASLIPVSSTGVVVNTVCPGLCKTNINRNAPDNIKAITASMMNQFGRTAEDGSRTLLFAAIAGANSHGKFSADCEIKDDSIIPDWITAEEAKDGQKRLWASISKEIESASPGSIAKILN